LGLLGVDIGLEISATDLRNSNVYESVSSDNTDFLIVPKLHVHKGLPLRLNIDAFYSTVLDGPG
jgi:hypothetical protein